MKQPAIRRWDNETTWVANLAACASIASFLLYYRAGDILLYGDAVAHINIARRVFDSRTPGLLQLGTVWLPLPHVLMMPFLVNQGMWQTGIGGSIPSMLAFVLGVVGVFRLARGVMHALNLGRFETRLVPWGAAAIYGLNPNLLYLQATAMTEAVYLAAFVWSVVHFQEFVLASDGILDGLDGGAKRSLWKCGLCVAMACLTRYDGWFLAAALGGVMAVLWWRQTDRASLLRTASGFVLLVAAIPVIWLVYNGIVYRNPLEFANGPYSAKAIERKTAKPGFPPHPGTHNLAVATLYFVKSGEVNVTEGWVGRLWLLLALAGSVALLLFDRRTATAWLLWVPVAFYALSIAYAGVPIFMPVWWPYSAYNVRYGLQLLPAFAVFLPIATAGLAKEARRPGYALSVGGLAAALVVASYVSVWRAEPVSYREASINSRTRVALETRLALELTQLPPDSSFLMYLGGHVGALQDAGIPLRRSVNEGNHRVWKQPSDPEGLWERALADPGQFVDFVVAIEGDPVADAMRGRTLPAIAYVEVAGQPTTTIYRAR